MTEFVQKNSYLIGLVLGVLFFLGTQVIGYVILREQVKTLMKNINGVGANVKEVRKDVGDNYLKLVEKINETDKKVERINGVLDGSRNPVSLPSK